MMRQLRRNWGWKLLSLGAAFVLWLTYSGARELTTALTVPVQYRNIPKHLEISSDLIEEAHLVVRGPSTQLSRLSAAEMPVIIDLEDVKTPGQRTYTIDRKNTSLPPAVVLDRVLPPQIRLVFEPRITRRVPVTVRFENVPEGRDVEGFVVEPPTLEVFGPRSSVEKVDRVEADPIDLSLPESEGGYRATVFAGDHRLNFTSSPTVRVKVRLTGKRPSS